MKRATEDELKTQIATLIAEADQLKAKADSEEGLTPEETTKLEDLVSQIEKLQADLAAAQTAQRFNALKQRANAPVRSAPVFDRVAATVKSEPSFGEAFSLWMRAKTPEGDNSPEAFYKARSAGFDLNSSSARLPVNYRGLNFKQRAKNRTIMSKGGVGSGLELVWQSYSDKVVEYLTYESPLLGLLGSETTADGNLRTYFKYDNTAMKSTYTSASGGTEVAPTIPEKNLVTSNQVIGCFDITSGVQKVSFNSLRDSYISLEDKIAKANADSHARMIEQEIVTAAGNGTTGVSGLMNSDTAIADEGVWSREALERLYFSVPAQYRANCVFLSNGDSFGNIFSALRNDVGDSLFGKLVQEDVEFDVLMGKKFVQSDYMPDNTVLFFNPEYYMLRLVEGQLFQQFSELYWPNVGWAGVMTFGGAYIGPSAAIKSLHVSSGS